jgi:hypothetical protein
VAGKKKLGSMEKGSMLWSQFSAIFANFWQRNMRFSKQIL